MDISFFFFVFFFFFFSPGFVRANNDKYLPKGTF
tara:strand:- start:199 stop:300 length:102 start_codon:yes stop_codon:yes gene_type:complete